MHQELLKDEYVDEHWREAFNIIMEAEGDTAWAAEGVERLAHHVLHHTGLTIRIPASMHPPQLIALEEALSDSIQTLKSRNWIFGPPPTINEVLDPKEEQEIGDSEYAFEGGDAEIVTAVQHELAVERGEIAETVESDDKPEDGQMPPKLVYTDLISMCKTLEAACIHVSDADSTLDLARLLCQFCGTLRREELQNARVQSKLNQYFIRK